MESCISFSLSIEENKCSIIGQSLVSISEFTDCSMTSDSDFPWKRKNSIALPLLAAAPLLSCHTLALVSSSTQFLRKDSTRFTTSSTARNAASNFAPRGIALEWGLRSTSNSWYREANLPRLDRSCMLPSSPFGRGVMAKVESICCSAERIGWKSGWNRGEISCRNCIKVLRWRAGGKEEERQLQSSSLPPQESMTWLRGGEHAAPASAS
mmetsp:Transcript_32551/g.73170  ORF Transcript_32551/g.73170 Transcript_32551/m.73170 type:complete len:210 (-) Transcript_32551:791-1420(-)